MKNAKITNQSHAYKGYSGTYIVEMLNSFNSELQPEDTESAIRNKLRDILSAFKWFKFVTNLVLEFKKLESVDETKCLYQITKRIRPQMF